MSFPRPLPLLAATVLGAGVAMGVAACGGDDKKKTKTVTVKKGEKGKAAAFGLPGQKPPKQPKTPTSPEDLPEGAMPPEGVPSGGIPSGAAPPSGIPSGGIPSGAVPAGPPPAAPPTPPPGAGAPEIPDKVRIEIKGRGFKGFSATAFCRQNRQICNNFR